MSVRPSFARILATFSAFIGLAAACSSSTHRATPGADAGASNHEEAGAAGESLGGAAGNSVGAEAGSAGDVSAAGTEEAGGSSSQGGTGGMVDGAGAPGAGGTPQMVTAYGCFGRSGDGLDALDDGSPAVLLNGSAPYSAPCGQSWISDNANAYAPETPPTTIIMRRRFIVDPSISSSGTFTISYKVDDGVNFVLNGHAIASCMPTSDNLGACQQACGSTAVATSALLGDGQVNTLEIHVINLQSVPAGGSNFGYTAVSYQMCVAGPP